MLGLIHKEWSLLPLERKWSLLPLVVKQTNKVKFKKGKERQRTLIQRFLLIFRSHRDVPFFKKIHKEWSLLPLERKWSLLPLVSKHKVEIKSRKRKKQRYTWPRREHEVTRREEKKLPVACVMGVCPKGRGTSAMSAREAFMRPPVDVRFN